nr:pre coat protein [Papaya leaf curl Karnataka virus]
MPDPLVNELPETVHGFRCMLAVKYQQLVEKSYVLDTLGRDLIRELISVIRARNYVEVSSRNNHLHVRFEGTPSSQLCHPIFEPCCCPHCPGRQSKGMGQQTHVPEALDVQDVQKP